MFLKGINYDVGTYYSPGVCSRPVFDDDAIRSEIRIIRNDLHCECIRISGYDIERLMKTSKFALELGLQVWLSPILIDATQEQIVKYLYECAVAAEKLREKNDNIVFVAGCEYSLFVHGFMEGNDFNERSAKIFSLSGFILNAIGFRNKAYKKMDAFFDKTVKNIRSVFNGKVTYASGTWEKVDWSIFDIVSINHYRASYNQSSYVKKLRSYYKYGKPVAVTEFGCCTYEGAEKAGAGGWNIIEEKDGKRIIKGTYKRSESVQANYIAELLEIFKKEDIYASFVFIFNNPDYEYNPDPLYDFDMASYALMKPVHREDHKGLDFLPKEAFYRLAKYYLTS